MASKGASSMNELIMFWMSAGGMCPSTLEYIEEEMFAFCSQVPQILNSQMFSKYVKNIHISGKKYMVLQGRSDKLLEG